MSSHHFVREGQEPALFILDPISHEHLGHLLEWAPLVVVPDNILDDILPLGFKIDVVVVTDENRAACIRKMEMQIPYDLVAYSTPADLISNTLAFLLSKKQTGVTAITHREEVFDAEWYQSTMAVSILNEHTRWVLTPGQFEKWFAEGSLLQLRDDNKSIVIKGDIDRFARKIAVKSDGIVRIEGPAPLWVGEVLTD